MGGTQKKRLGGAPSARRLGRRHKAASEGRGEPKAFFSSLGPAYKARIFCYWIHYSFVLAARNHLTNPMFYVRIVSI